MNKERRQELADLLLSQHTSIHVPSQIPADPEDLGTGLSKEEFVKLLLIFENSTNLKEDLNKFLKILKDEYEFLKNIKDEE